MAVSPFIRIEGSEGYLNTDVRISAIVGIADNKKHGSRVLLSSGAAIPTPERIEHLKMRIERLDR